MTNNDILMSLRYCFDFKNKQMVEIFGFAGNVVTTKQVTSWLKKEDHADYVACDDKTLVSFLDGFITKMRGKRDGAEPSVEISLNNNVVFRKIKIALNLQAQDVVGILDSTGFGLSKHELSAFFRKQSHKNYRECQDQVLRYFLSGLKNKYRAD